MKRQTKLWLVIVTFDLCFIALDIDSHDQTVFAKEPMLEPSSDGNCCRSGSKVSDGGRRTQEDRYSHHGFRCYPAPTGLGLGEYVRLVKGDHGSFVS